MDTAQPTDPIDDHVGESGEIGCHHGEQQVTIPCRLVDADDHRIRAQSLDDLGQALGVTVNLDDGRHLLIEVRTSGYPGDSVIDETLPTVGNGRW